MDLTNRPLNEFDQGILKAVADWRARRANAI
jgi:hypothetical protein